MTQFWLIAAGMILLALGFIIFPLFKKGKTETVDRNTLNISVIKQQLQELEADLKDGKLEQTVYDAARADLEKALLWDVDETNTITPPNDNSARFLVAILAISIPVFSYLLYQQLGTPEAIGADTTTLAQQPQHTAGAQNPAAPEMTMEEAIDRLTKRLEQEPDNAQGWEMLARTYMSLKQFDKAIGAYDKLYGLVGNNPELLVSYADALAMAQGGNITGKPYDMIKTALKQDPSNAQANWMAGMAEAELGNHQAALKHWRTIRPLLTAQPKLLNTLDQMIARAESQLSGAPPPVASVNQETETSAAPAPTTAGTEKIMVEVKLAPELATLANPDDTVFIFAQAMQGPPMPLAVSRQQVKNLPVTVSLDDSMAMMPQMKLSAFDQVKVGARISKSGQAMPSSGDLSGSVDSIKPGQDEPVKVLINQKIP